MVVNNVAVVSIAGTYPSLPDICVVALTRCVEYGTGERERKVNVTVVLDMRKVYRSIVVVSWNADA